MNEREDSYRDEFIQYLSTKIDSNGAELSELCLCYESIERECVERKIIDGPLFSVRDRATVEKVSSLVADKSIYYRLIHRAEYNRKQTAVAYWSDFVAELCDRDREPAQAAEQPEPKEPAAVSPVAESPDAPVLLNDPGVSGASASLTSADLRLQKKYPDLYPHVYKALRELSAENDNGVTVEDLRARLGIKSLAAEVENILDNAAWTVVSRGRYRYADPTARTEPPEDQSTGSQSAGDVPGPDVPVGENWIPFKFDNAKYMMGTRPVYCSFRGHVIVERNWRQELAALTEYLISDENPMIPSLYTGNLTTRTQSTPFFMKRRISGQAAICLTNGYWVSTQYSIPHLVKRIAALAMYCGYKRDEILLYGVLKDLAATPKPPKPQPSEPLPMSYGNELIAAVLRYVKGYDLSSLLEYDRFAAAYKEMYGKDIDLDEEQLTAIIKKLCIIHNKVAYLPDVMLDAAIREKLFRYIDDTFDGGAQAIYYKALYKRFGDDFLNHSKINDAGMLKSYLTHVCCGRYYLHKAYLSRVPQPKIDMVAEIRDVMLNAGHPLSLDEIYAALPHLPQEQIMQKINSTDEFICGQNNRRFHISIVQLSDRDLEDIAQIIDAALADRGYLSGNELYDAIAEKYPEIIQNNSELGMLELRKVLKVRLAGRYSFIRNIVSRVDSSLSRADVWANYARSHESFTYDDLKAHAKELGGKLYLDVVCDNSLRVSKNSFVSRSRAHFDTRAIDAAIDKICVGDYITLQDAMNQAMMLPDVDFPWTGYLLETYVRFYSESFKFISHYYTHEDYSGAIVRRRSAIGTAADLTVDALLKNNVPLNESAAVEWLYENGYLPWQSYTDIAECLKKAVLLREKKGVD